MTLSYVRRGESFCNFLLVGRYFIENFIRHGASGQVRSEKWGDLYELGFEVDEETNELNQTCFVRSLQQGSVKVK